MLLALGCLSSATCSQLLPWLPRACLLRTVLLRGCDSIGDCLWGGAGWVQARPDTISNRYSSTIPIIEINKCLLAFDLLDIAAANAVAWELHSLKTSGTIFCGQGRGGAGSLIRHCYIPKLQVWELTDGSNIPILFPYLL